MFVYLITNTLNGHKYVGRTVQKLAKRFNVHKNNAKNGLDTHLCRAIRAYGIENFIIEAIETATDVESLNRQEIHWIRVLKPEYNMTDGGDGGDTSFSPNYKLGILRRELNRALSGRRSPYLGKFGSDHPCFGQKRSEEQRERLRDGVLKSWASADRRREDQRQRMFGLNLGAKKNAKPIVFDNNEFVSLTEASRLTGRSISYIKKNCTYI